MELADHYDAIIIGGGACGFMTAIQIAMHNVDASIAIVEKSRKTLSKVRISGGGRCNITHACWTPKELIEFYPRGGIELLGPFHSFMPTDTLHFFKQQGVTFKIEADNRIFPTSDSSEQIASTLESTAKECGIDLFLRHNFTSFEVITSSAIQVAFANKKNVTTKNLMLACGSSTRVWQLLKGKGVTIIPPVPSLFTFNIDDNRIRSLPGVSVPRTEIQIIGTEYIEEGPILVTHWGLSGPSILKLSARAARELHQKDYTFTIRINFIPGKYSDWKTLAEDWKTKWRGLKLQEIKQPFLPKRLFQSIMKSCHISQELHIDNFTKAQYQDIYKNLCEAAFTVNGKSTFKEEFVTAGGIDLKEVDMRTFQLKSMPHVYAGGEILNIDGLTGGFNFQAAWTAGYIAGKHIAESLK